MTEFLVIVLAIVVSNFVILAMMMLAMSSEKFAIWYAKKAFKMSKVVSKEMENMFEEEGF